MAEYEYNQYTMQTYFKKLCDSFYVAYKEIKRIKEMYEELEKTDPQQELEMVKRILKISALEEGEEFEGKYISHKYSEKELEERKAELVELKEQHEKDSKKLNEASEFWSELYEQNIKQIFSLLKKIHKKDFEVIVTSKEEILALMEFFSRNSLTRYRIISMDENCLKSFPSGEEMYIEFYAAYSSVDNARMEEVIQKYF